MKRKLLALVATLIIVFGTTLVPAGSFLISEFGAQTAYAQVQDPNGSGQTGPYAPTDPNGTGNQSTTYGPTNTTNQTTNPQDQTVTPPPDNQSGTFECGYTDILCGLVKLINILLNSITNLIATVAGLILDFSIHFSISSSTYANDTVNSILVSGWKLIRDFSTIFLMFALFVVGFLLIFNAEGSDGSWAAHFSPGRTIARVIIVALLVNFSFLMCRSVIDVGNVFALVLYDKVDQGNASVQSYPSAGSIDTSTMFGKPSEVFKNLGISNIKSISVGLLANINPQRVILDPSLVAANKTKAAFGSGYNYSFYVAYLFVSFIEAILNLLLLFIFASMAFLFLGRVIGLYLAIVLSPFAFVSWTIPFLENMPYIGFDNWLKDFVGLTLLGPVYMLFVYLTVAFMRIPETIVTGSNPFMVAVFATIDALLCVFVLLKGKSIAESMAGEFGKMVGSFAGKLAVAGVGLATGGTAFLASQTVGRVGSAVATNGTLNRLANSGQDTESVQQRMQTASNFRSKKFLGYQVGKTKLGQAIGGSIERGDFNGKVMTGKLFGATKNLGKTIATVNPLDATIAGTSIRRATGAIATAGSGKKPLIGTDGKPVMGPDGKPVMVADNTLEKGLAKDYVSQLKNQTIKGRAIDIAGIRNEKNTITNNQTAAVTQGLGNPLASQPSTGKPAGSGGTVTVTPGAGNGTAGGVTQTFKLAGNAPIAKNQKGNGMQRQGFTGGSIRPLTPSTNASPTATPPTNPPTTPPTGGAIPTGSNNNPPKPSAVPIRLAGNAPLEEKTSGVTMPRTVFNQNLKPTTTPSTSSKENIPSLTGDEEMDDVLRKSVAPKHEQHGPTLTGDEEMDDVLRSHITTPSITPATKSGSSATNFLSGIQGTPVVTTNTPQATQQTQPIIQQVVTQQPTQTTIIKEVSSTSSPIIQTTQPTSKIVEQPPQTVVRQENVIQQASTLTGSTSSAIKNIQSTQKSLEEKNIENSLLNKNNPRAESNQQALDKIDAANLAKINEAQLIKHNIDRAKNTQRATEPFGENLDKILQMPDSQEKTNLLNQHNAQIENAWKESLDT